MKMKAKDVKKEMIGSLGVRAAKAAVATLALQSVSGLAQAAIFNKGTAVTFIGKHAKIAGNTAKGLIPTSVGEKAAGIGQKIAGNSVGRKAGELGGKGLGLAKKGVGIVDNSYRKAARSGAMRARRRAFNAANLASTGYFFSDRFVTDEYKTRNRVDKDIRKKLKDERARDEQKYYEEIMKEEEKNKKN